MYLEDGYIFNMLPATRHLQCLSYYAHSQVLFCKGNVQLKVCSKLSVRRTPCTQKCICTVEYKHWSNTLCPTVPNTYHTTPHHTPPHYTTPHHTTSHHFAHHTTLHYTTHHTTLHHTPHHTTPHHITQAHTHMHT